MKTTTIYGSAARTATPTAVTAQAGRYNFLRVVLDLTALAATPGLTLTVDGLDPVSGKYYNLLTGASVVAVSTNVYEIGPGLPVTANVSASKPLPDTIRFTVTHVDADSATYSLSAMFMD
jgi:hypothetical protein